MECTRRRLQALHAWVHNLDSQLCYQQCSTLCASSSFTLVCLWHPGDAFLPHLGLQPNVLWFGIQQLHRWSAAAAHSAIMYPCAAAASSSGSTLSSGCTLQHRKQPLALIDAAGANENWTSLCTARLNHGHNVRQLVLLRGQRGTAAAAAVSEVCNHYIPTSAVRQTQW